jgi:hypothetical protein
MLQHEKLWTMLILVLAVVFLAYAPVFAPSAFYVAGKNGVLEATGALRILDVAVGGLIVALGHQAAGTRSSTEQGAVSALADSTPSAHFAALVAGSPKPAEVKQAVEQGAEDGTRQGVESALNDGTIAAGRQAMDQSREQFGPAAQELFYQDRRSVSELIGKEPQPSSRKGALETTAAETPEWTDE